MSLNGTWPTHIEGLNPNAVGIRVQKSFFVGDQALSAKRHAPQSWRRHHS